MRRGLAGSFIAAAIVVAAMPAGAATKTVVIPDLSFQPATVKIVVGDTVRWVNQDNRRHTVTANSSSIALGESFDSSSNCPGLLNNCMRRGDTFTHTFTHEGTFTYRCKLHGSDTSFSQCAMCGRVVVSGLATLSPSPPPPTLATSTGTPTSTGSPTATASTTPTGSITSPGGPQAAPPSEDGTLPVVAIAAGAVVLLAGSGMLVYRTYLKR
jgi:plastocyanin